MIDKSCFISETAQIGRNVTIGRNTIIYENVVLGDNSVVGANCILGERLNGYSKNPDSYRNPTLIIGVNAQIRSGTILYAGSTIGMNFQTGHNVVVREQMNIGRNCSLGTMSDLQGFATIGNYCRFHSNVHIGQGSNIDDFVFIYPFVVLTNDPHPPSNLCIGASIGKYSQIAVHSIILPGTKIGENCLVAANSTVGGNFADEQLIVGSPATSIGNIRKIKSKLNTSNGEPYYPWMYHFERGMPWEGIGFESWKKNKGEND